MLGLYFGKICVRSNIIVDCRPNNGKFYCNNFSAVFDTMNECTSQCDTMACHPSVCQRCGNVPIGQFCGNLSYDVLVNDIPGGRAKTWTCN
jgi:hypothetical protein